MFGSKRLFLLMPFFVACSNQEDKSNISSIINGTNDPRWDVLTKESHSSLDVMPNVFQIKIGKELVGTGFVLGSNETTLVTNAHVATFLKRCEFYAFSDCSLKTASNYFNSIELGDVITMDTQLDFALISLNWKNVTVKPIELTIPCNDTNNSMAENAHVFIIGSLIDETFAQSKGVVTEQDIIKKLKPSFLYTADTLPGMSGSPVFDANSNLIGLHWGSCINKACNQAIPFFLINQKYSLKECNK